MTRSIRDILPERSDFSPLLVHLTRGQGEGKARRASARRRLLQILRSRLIRAHNPHGLLTRNFENLPRQVPPKYLKAVCLTDTPLEQLWTVIGDIWARKHRLDRYGLVFSKSFVMNAGGNPVIYLCTQSGNALVDAFLELLRRRLESRAPLHDDVAPLLPLVESFGRGYFNRKKTVDFSWEREWRVPGDLKFRKKDVLLGLCHERDIERLERLFKPIKFVDPLGDTAQWGAKVNRARERAWKEYLERFP